MTMTPEESDLTRKLPEDRWHWPEQYPEHYARLRPSPEPDTGPIGEYDTTTAALRRTLEGLQAMRTEDT